MVSKNEQYNQGEKVQVKYAGLNFVGEVRVSVLLTFQ